MATKMRPKAKAPTKSFNVSKPGKPKTSSLPKMWNKFLVQGDRAILIGNFSQGHRRFKGNNLQGASNCVMACAFSKLNKMEKWTSNTIDRLLENGTNLHLKSLQYLTNKCTIFVDPPQVHKYFFLGDVKVTMKVDTTDVIVQKLRVDQNPAEVLRDKITLLLKGHESGIFACQHKYLAVWTSEKGFFLFDPEEHSLDGGKWEGVPGLGFCYVMKFNTVAGMAATILGLLHFDLQTKFVLYPCAIEKLVKINTKPPETVDGKLEPLPKLPKAPKKEKKFPEVKMLQPQGSQLSVNLLVEEPSKIPLEKVRLKSVTHFCEFPNGGILRAFNHQNDPEFSRFCGGQSFANAVAALTMLRVAKAKRWVRKTLDTILLLGEVIQEELQFLPPKTMVEKISLDGRVFAPQIKHYAAMGKLRSTQEEILELLPVLGDFLSTNDVTIIVGPLVVAVWTEDNSYYMFDPNERNEVGQTDNTNGPGAACVTWYNTVKNLVNCYLGNVDKTKRRDPFYLCKVAIEDYVEIADQWNNFKGIAKNKWILRGTFNQNDRRFEKDVSRNTQCTANATMALVFTEIKEEEDWDAGTIDQVLVKGDNFYKSCVEELKAKNKFVHPMLMVDELKRNFSLDDKEVKLEIDDCLVNGITNAKSETGVPNLRKGFEQFFQDNEAGVVTSHNLSMAIWRRDSTFYYFDSHSRDDRGVSCSYGTACVLRLMTVEELARSVQTNYGPNSQDAYNISRIGVRLMEITEDGIVVPPLNHYEEVRDLVAILRSTTSTNGPEFGLNRGKQTVPMCLVALGMNTITESALWSQQDLDEILKIGDTLYVESMEANLDSPEDQDDITSNNVKNQHSIGLNRITVEMEQFAEGNMETNVEEAITSFFGVETPSVGIFESSYVTAALWSDKNSFYLFDPKPRDENGEVFGKDVWSVKAVEEEEVVEVGVKSQVDQLGGGDNLGDGSQDYDADELNVAMVDTTGSDGTDVEEIGEEEEEKEEPVVEVKYSEVFQNAQANLDGKACVLRFSRVGDVVRHLVDNSPPNRREEIQFSLKRVKVENKPMVKEVEDPGDWFNFKEVDSGKWILRGTKDLEDVLFLVENRGKQMVPSCFAALAFVRLYSLTKFKSTTIDSILAYGDRLYTSTKRRKQQLLRQNKDLALTEEEILAITSDQVFTLENYPKKICIGEHLALIDLQIESITGDINAKNLEDIFDIERGLKKLFESHRYAILEAKGLTVAVWRLATMFYMFDPNPRGPNGVRSPIGVPCLTRFAKLEDLVVVFLKNLPRDGSNLFVLHGVAVQQSQCPRQRQPEEVKSPEELYGKLGGFRPVVAGKWILRGTRKEDYAKFDRGCHVQGAAVAFVALAMALVQKTETWTQAVVDEILILGDELHGETVRRLGMGFNGWVDKIDVRRVKNDFKIGTLKANCEVRFRDQRGLVDVKNSRTPNLRQGIENFFLENTHGVLAVDNLILPLWEEEKDAAISIYMYDPNARGPSGLPMPGGTACTVKFCNAKMASDHILSMIPAADKSEVPFVITPVEIVVGVTRTKRKHPRVVGKEETVAPPIAKCREVKVATEQQRKLRAIAEEERRQKECGRLASLGRNEFYKLSDVEAILRGLRCMSQNRDIPTNFVAFVMTTVSSIDKWSFKQLEVILETGNQLYIDSHVAYNPKNKQLGLMGVLRKFYVKNLQVHLTLYKPTKLQGFTSARVADVIERYFQQENFTIINYGEKYVSVHLKGGRYYYFDPYSRDLHGNKAEKGCCMVMRFSNVESMAQKIVDNIGDDDREVEPFYLISLSIKDIIKGKESQ